jgi:GNAT superfamily N-acetyltransferase
MLADLQLRLATPSDAPALASVIAGANMAMTSHYTPGFLQENLPPDSPEDILEIMQRRQMFVAVRAGKIVGTCSLKEIALGMMYVDTAQHGQGIGTALLHYVMGRAKDMGLRTLQVYAALNAVPFYTQNGFKSIRTEISHASFPAVLMQIALTHDAPVLLHMSAFTTDDIPSSLFHQLHTHALSGYSNTQDIRVLYDRKAGFKALIAGGRDYDFQRGIHGYRIQILNASDTISNIDKTELAMQICQYVYYTGGRYISFPEGALSSELKLILTRTLKSDVIADTIFLHENDFRNFVAYQN